MSQTLDLRPALDAIERIEDRRVRNMTQHALSATIGSLTRRKEPLPGDALPVSLVDYVECLRRTFADVLHLGTPMADFTDTTYLIDRAVFSAMVLAGRKWDSANRPLVTEMFGYAFSNIPHLASLAAGNEPTPWI